MGDIVIYNAKTGTISFYRGPPQELKFDNRDGKYYLGLNNLTLSIFLGVVPLVASIKDLAYTNLKKSDNLVKVIFCKK